MSQPKKVWCEKCGGWGEWVEAQPTFRYVRCEDCLGAGLITPPVVPEPDTFYQNCSYCEKPIKIEWDNGVVSRPDFVLIADWVYCTECWDKQIEEHPP